MELFGSNINLFRARKRETTDTATTTITSGVSGGSFKENVVRVRNPQAALAISGVYRAVSLRADTIAMMDMQYQRKDTERGNFIVDMGMSTGQYASYGTRMNWLLRKRPNPLMSATSLFKQLTINRLMLGNGFLYIERSLTDGEPVALWLARCNGYDPVNGLYVLTYLSDRGYRNVTAPRADVIHWPNTFRDDDGFWGMSTLRYAFKTLSLIATTQKQSLDTAAKGGRVKGFIGEEKPAQGVSTLAYGLMNKGEMDRYAAELNEKVYRQDITALRGLDKFVNVSMTAADMQMIEQMQMGLDDVARFFSVPRPLLMLDSNSHYTTPTAATQEFLRSIQPDAQELEDEFDTKLLSIYDYGRRRFHLCEQPLFRLDPETKAKVDKMELETGVKTVNELRSEHDMPTVENGDEPMASANLLTLKALIAKSEQTAQPATAPVSEPPKEGEE